MALAVPTYLGNLKSAQFLVFLNPPNIEARHEVLVASAFTHVAMIR